MVPSPPKITMASASLEEAGSPWTHDVGEAAWNGCKSVGDVPNPMAAARIRGALEHIRRERFASIPPRLWVPCSKPYSLRGIRYKYLINKYVTSNHQLPPAESFLVSY